MQEYLSTSPEDTLSLGRGIGEGLQGGELILLHGELGAGKTLITKAQGLGADPSIPIVSPSFTLVNIYKARLDIVHVDLYRLNSDEVFDLGLEEYMNKAHVMVVEWAEKAREFFSGDILELTLEYAGESKRRISMNYKESHP